MLSDGDGDTESKQLNLVETDWRMVAAQSSLVDASPPPTPVSTALRLFLESAGRELLKLSDLDRAVLELLRAWSENKPEEPNAAG